MLVRTDDEVYRVDAVWLGPPRATFPWRARYVSYGVGLLVMMLIMMVQRRLGIGLDFFSVAWALVGTVAITRVLGKKIDYERPLGQVLAHFWSEVTGPRAGRRAAGGAVRAGHVRVRGSRGAAPAAWATSASAGDGVSRRRDGVAGERSRRGSRARRVPGARRTAAVSAARATNGELGAAPGVQVPPPTPAGSARAEPRRVVPPLPEPVSAPRRGRFRVARGAGGRPSRTTANPARTRHPEPWGRGGHRGRA